MSGTQAQLIMEEWLSLCVDPNSTRWVPRECGSLTNESRSDSLPKVICQRYSLAKMSTSNTSTTNTSITTTSTTETLTTETSTTETSTANESMKLAYQMTDKTTMDNSTKFPDSKSNPTSTTDNSATMPEHSAMKKWETPVLLSYDNISTLIDGFVSFLHCHHGEKDKFASISTAWDLA